MREIEDILLFREDISPFLVHLTRDVPGRTAGESLRQIIQQRSLRAENMEVSDARFGGFTTQMTPEQTLRYFGAVCLTETPINEIHCLLEIAHRVVNLQPYGLVFLKDKMQRRGVSPVLYISNNTKRNGDTIVRAMFSLIGSHEEAAAKLLPLISVFGTKLTTPGVSWWASTNVDFRWEREWRYPSCDGPLTFDDDDVFVGICPHAEIDTFEALMPTIGFIDPTRNMKWYATKLIAARQKHDLKHSVV